MPSAKDSSFSKVFSVGGPSKAGCYADDISASITDRCPGSCPGSAVPAAFPAAGTSPG